MEEVICEFKMGLISRINVASRLWWDIVVRKETVCVEDSEAKEQVLKGGE